MASTIFDAAAKQAGLADLPSVQARVNAERCERSLAVYIRNAWHVVEPATVYKHNWHIDAMSEHLEAVLPGGQIRNLIISVAPRMMKSLQVSVFWPTWLWARKPSTRGEQPDFCWAALRFLYSAYAEALSVRDSVKCRTIIDSPWYRKRWGTRFKLSSDQNQKSRFENNRTGYRMATSVEGFATGEGGDAVVVDDPLSVEQSYSDLEREKVIRWWSETMSTRLNDPKTGVKVIIQQRTHDRDLVGHILATEEGWTHLVLPTEFHPKLSVQTGLGWKDPRTEEGELLFPERFGADENARAKQTLQIYGYSAQHDQNPVPLEGGILKGWKTYTKLPERFDDLVMSWDMSFKDLATSSFVVGQVWGRLGPDRYMLDQVRGHWDFNVSCQQVEAFALKWPQVRKRIVEDKANGPAIIAFLRNKVGLIPFPDRENGSRQEIELAGASKEARAFFCQPTLAAGNVWLPSETIAPWVTGLIAEWQRFPKGEHDDQVDAFTIAMIRLFLDEVFQSGVAGAYIVDHRERYRRSVPSSSLPSDVPGGFDPRGDEPRPKVAADAVGVA